MLMAKLLCCCAEGLLAYTDEWQRQFCPLPTPSLLAAEDGLLAVIDVSERLLWMNELLVPVDSGAECLLLWHGRPLVLSGDTDCLTMLDPCTGSPMFLTPAGVYPQDMCLLPGDRLAVCGGGSGTVLSLQLPELTLLQTFSLPGCVQRAAWHNGRLYALCTVENDALCTLLCRIHPSSGRYEALCTLPGLPGALHADRLLWIAAGDSVYQLRRADARPVRLCGGLGLVRHICASGHRVILSDPALDGVYLLESRTPPQQLLTGGVGQALFTS